MAGSNDWRSKESSLYKRWMQCGVYDMSMSINSSVDLIKRCKGNWLSVEHYILPKIPMKENEKYGYCSICWENDFKENNFGSRQGDIAHNFKQAGPDTL